MHPVLKLNNLLSCPFFKKNQMSFLWQCAHCIRSLLFSVTWGCLRISCLTAPKYLRCPWGEDTIPGCSSPGQISAFPSLPEMLMWAGSRAGVRHRAAYQHLLPPVCTGTGPSLHPPAAFLTPGGLNKQGVNIGCRGLCPLVLGDHLFPCLTQSGGQWGWVTLPCQWATPQERSWSFVFLWVKQASSSLITFNWVRPLHWWCRDDAFQREFRIAFRLCKVISSAFDLFGFQWCSKYVILNSYDSYDPWLMVPTMKNFRSFVMKTIFSVSSIHV